MTERRDDVPYFDTHFDESLHQRTPLLCGIPWCWKKPVEGKMYCADEHAHLEPTGKEFSKKT